MGIIYDEDRKLFHLKTRNTSYIIQVYKNKQLCNVYWGKKVNDINPEKVMVVVDRPYSTHYDLEDKTYSLDSLTREYPTFGNSDYRNPSLEATFFDGSRVIDLEYDSYQIEEGKTKLLGLPSIYGEKQDEVQTLHITLKDRVQNLTVILTYSVLEDYETITKSVQVRNDSKKVVTLDKVLSCNVDFNRGRFDFLHLSGSWARERHIVRTGLRPGIQSIESKRGASSHQHNPFIALLDQDATEEYGNVYGFNLVYSGNFNAGAEVDQYRTTRAYIGLNSNDFSWKLNEGETFQAPEAVLVYSDKGLGGMSRIYHKLYRERLCKGSYRDKVRPILVNNWEATYFDFNEEKILNLALNAKELGVELVVLDDGWFGARNGDTSSLGDWFVNREKLPNGLKSLAEKINEMGLKFGLWVEPEMISVDSNLYITHPDWCIHIPGRSKTEGRNQLVLDLARREICDFIIEQISGVLSDAPIEYVKWDMNRHMTEFYSIGLEPSRQKETAHRYMLGLYYILDEITARYPEVLFESCSGGGGRFDPGMLYYMPQTWTSDDTDAVERLYIQYGTSLVYPISTMGAHVSAVPNHQVGRNTSLKMRADVAMSGNFGYELDLTKLTEEEKEIMKAQISQYKKLREFVQFGDMYRLISPFEQDSTSWMVVSKDKKEVFVAYFKIQAMANPPLEWIKLRGLDDNAKYQDITTGKIYGGDELMHAGLVVPELMWDYTSLTWHFQRI